MCIKMKKKLGITLLCIALLCLSSCKPKAPTATVTAFSISKAMKARCEFAKAELMDLKNEIRLFGKIEADNNKTAHVFSVVGGLVTSINVGLGDYVKQKELLATIQSSQAAEYEQEHLDAIGEIAIAEKKSTSAAGFVCRKIKLRKGSEIG